MNVETFRRWLAEHGCRFEDGHSHGQGHGHPQVVARLEGRRSALPMIGSDENIDPGEVRRVVEELGLDARELPGAQAHHQASHADPRRHGEPPG